MEGNYWNRNRDINEPDRDRNKHNASRYQGPRLDQDAYRGAYRFDIDSNHHNVSTWDWHPAQSRQQGHDYNRNFNRDFNRNYNRDYNRNYNEPDRDRGYDHDNYNTDSRYRDQGSQRYRSSNYADWNDKSHYGSQRQDSRPRRQIDSDPYGAGNFNADYGPDHYGQGGGENYGNEAGSLSFGYDGTSNYDPDWNSRYDPLSGHRRSYHGYYTSRHPERNEYPDNAARGRAGYDREERR